MTARRAVGASPTDLVAILPDRAPRRRHKAAMIRSRRRVSRGVLCVHPHPAESDEETEPRVRDEMQRTRSISRAIGHKRRSSRRHVTPPPLPAALIVMSASFAPPDTGRTPSRPLDVRCSGPTMCTCHRRRLAGAQRRARGRVPQCCARRHAESPDDRFDTARKEWKAPAARASSPEGTGVVWGETIWYLRERSRAAHCISHTRRARSAGKGCARETTNGHPQNGRRGSGASRLLQRRVSSQKGQRSIRLCRGSDRPRDRLFVSVS